MSHSDAAKPRSTHMQVMQELVHEMNLAEDPFEESGAEEARGPRRWGYAQSNVPMEMEHPGGGTTKALVHTRNLSAHGIAVLYDGFLHKGSLCQVTLTRRDDERTVISGTVVTCRHVQHVVHEIGILFDKAIDPTAYLNMEDAGGSDDNEPIEPNNLRGRVLFLDDCAADRRLMEHHLRQTNIRLSFAESLPEAREQMSEQRFDIVLCDLNIEQEDGVEFVSELRTSGYRGMIVTVSAETSVNRLNEAKSAGADHHLAKPYMPNHLVDLMSQLHRELGAAIRPKWLQSTLEDQPGMGDLVGAFISDAEVVAKEIEDAVHKADLELVRRLCLELRGSADGHGFAHLGRVAGDAVKSLDATMSIEESNNALRRLTLLAESVAARAHQPEASE